LSHLKEQVCDSKDYISRLICDPVAFLRVGVGWDRQEGGDQGGEEIEKVEKNEAQEVFVVLVSQTIVHKSAMVVEFLHTTLTVGAVEGPSRLDNPAIEAEIIQVNALFIG
jgi:hypothetical protein